MYHYKIDNKYETLTVGKTDYQKGKIYRIDFDNGWVYVGSTTRTLEKHLGEHANDPKSIIYRHRDENRKYSDMLLNKRRVERKNPAMRYSFKIERECELRTRMEKMTKIIDNAKNKELMI